MAKKNKKSLGQRVGQFLVTALHLDEAISRDPAKSAIKRVGYALVPSAGGGGGRQNFESPDTSFDTLTAAYDTDSYIRQAIDKYVDLIWKAGWQLKGKDEKSLEYIKLRLAVIAESTDVDTNAFFNEISESVVKYANAFVIKARLKQALSIPGMNIAGQAGVQPVGGYFVVAPATVTILRDPNGNVTKYKQKGQGSQKKELNLNPADMVHFTWKKPLGKAFGVSFLVPVLDDIRLLREIEENVSNLIYKYLHPLYKFMVGSTEAGKESTPEEIDYVRTMLEEMPMDGTMVLPERYDVQVVGAEGEAINANWAISYFEKRVFTGLGVPETVFGRAGTANKSTAENLTVEMHDRVKAFQRVIADQINFRIVRELLMEGGYDPLLKPEQNVWFEFKEIAIDERIKLENQAVYLWEHNTATFEETRLALGKDPVADEKRLHFNMVIDPAAMAAAEGGTPETNNKVKPTNQHGTKTSPKKTAASVGEAATVIRNESYSIEMTRAFTNLKADLIAAIGSDRQDRTAIYMGAARERMVKLAGTYLASHLSKGIIDVKQDCRVDRMPEVKVQSAVRQMLIRSQADLERLFGDLETSLVKNQSADSKENKLLAAAACEALQFRVKFMARTQASFAYNLGYALGAQSLGRETVHLVREGECSRCNEAPDTISIGGLSMQKIMAAIPPFHANCACHIEVK